MENRIDYYSGFEGEKEVSIWCEDDENLILWHIHLWYGYLSQMVRELQVNANGEWDGLAMIYHASNEFMDGEQVEIKDLSVVISQLRAIDPARLSERAAMLAKDLCNRLGLITEKHHVYIRED